jgi:hypothetical protein
MLLRAFRYKLKWHPPNHKLDASTIPNTQQQNNMEDGSFLMLPGISTIEKANGSKNTHQYQVIL